MPSVEIAALGAAPPKSLPDYRHFQLQLDSQVLSHRELFQLDLAGLNGVMAHLANLDCDPERGWFAPDLIDWRNPNILRFHEPVFQELETLLAWMMELSPEKSLLFLTDYQFGPDEARREEVRTLGDFLQSHQAGQLQFNTLYPLTG